MARPTENTGFICLNCTKIIKKLTNGSYRNHCPYCLYSLHLDNQPGDRANKCRGLMEPISLTYKPKTRLADRSPLPKMLPQSCQ